MSASNGHGVEVVIEHVRKSFEGGLIRSLEDVSLKIEPGGRQGGPHRATQQVLPDQPPPGHPTNTSPLSAFSQPRRPLLAALAEPHPAPAEHLPLARQ